MFKRRFQLILSHTLFASILLTSVLSCGGHPGASPGFAKTLGEVSIINGAEVPTPKTPAAKSVVLIEVLRPSGFTNIVCTGSLIGHHTVLTAAHCFDKKLIGPYIIYNIVFTDKYSKNRDEKLVRHGLGFSPHPLYNSAKIYDHDIAVMIFGGEIPDSYEPVALNTDTTTDFSNENIYVYGYGRSQNYTGIKGEDLTVSAGVLRRGLMRIDGNYFKTPDRYFTSLASESRLCQGDSGGPEFIQNGAEPKQIGINSAELGKKLKNGIRDCSGVSQATKVATFYSWIMQEQQRLLNVIRANKGLI